jgi:hypothetical protein
MTCMPRLASYHTSILVGWKSLSRSDQWEMNVYRTVLVQAKVKEISSELEPLEKEFAQIERQAFTWRSFVAYSGLVLLLAQFTLFARLTYWELSWDVMEPISYFTGQLVVRARRLQASSSSRKYLSFTSNSMHLML